jgi:hypothetical protein
MPERAGHAGRGALCLDAQEGRGGELADLFAALPILAVIEVVGRRVRGEE